jgi:hypothetical protein
MTRLHPCPSLARTAIAAAIAGAAAAASAAPYYTEEAAPFDALIGSAAQHQDFSAPFTQTGTTWHWDDVSFTCHAVEWCDDSGYFFGGYSETFNFVEGHFVYYAPPDSATFTFAAPIIAFGVDVYGIGSGLGSAFGSLQPTPMQVGFDGGSHEFFSTYVSNYNISVPVFAGILFDRPVTSVTVWGSWEGNGMFFTNLRYVAAPVPEPPAAWLAGAGLALLGGFAARRRKLSSVHSF